MNLLNQTLICDSEQTITYSTKELEYEIRDGKQDKTL